MKLSIRKEYDKSFEEDNYKLSVSMLNMPAVHLFIASNIWEGIELEIQDSIPDNALRTFALSGAPVKVVLPEELTAKTVKLLCDLYPEKSGSIRKAYMTGGDIREVLAGCIV